MSNATKQDVWQEVFDARRREGLPLLSAMTHAAEAADSWERGHGLLEETS